MKPAFIHTKHNIDELYGYLTDMENSSLDPIKFRRYTLGYITRAKRISVSLRHDFSSFEQEQNIPKGTLKKIYTWEKYGQTTPITNFIYKIRNFFEHEQIFIPRVMVTMELLPNTPRITAELNLSEFTGEFQGLPLRAFLLDKNKKEEREIPITLTQVRYYFHEWGAYNEHGEPVPEKELLISIPDVLTICQRYADSVNNFFKNIQEALDISK